MATTYSGTLTPQLQTLGRSDAALSFRRRLKDPSPQERDDLDLPAKTIPAGKQYRDDQVLEEARGVNEFYKQVDSTDLLNARGNDGLHIESLDQQLQWSRPEEYDFTFLEYTDAHQISKIEAFQMVGILDLTSDFLTVPLQPLFYGNIDEEVGLDDEWYQKMRTGTELFLRACHEQGTDKPIMGGIPPVDLPFLEDLLNLYEQYDVCAFYVDFNWNLPTRPDKVARVSYVMRRIANQRLHNDVLLYALNSRRGTFDGDVGYRPAANFATAMMGFDIIGGNHTGPNLPPDRGEEMERRTEFRLFKRELPGFIDCPIDRIDNNFPDRTAVDSDTLAQRSQSDSGMRRYEKILNAEQMELELAEWRDCLAEGRSEEYLATLGPAHSADTAGQRVRQAFEEGLQSELGEWT